MSVHRLLTGADLHGPWHYEQETDPGAVGAGLYWFKKSTKIISRRNDANDGWVSILTSSNSSALPMGTDWTGFTNAYNALDPGDTLILPNDTIIQEAQWGIRKSVRVVGGGPASRILNDNLNISNSIWIGFGDGAAFGDYLIPYVELSGFTIEQNRVNVERCLAISLYSGASNIHLRELLFKDITSDPIIVRNQGAIETRPEWKILQGIYVINNEADEWYETFYNHREGSASDCYVINNNIHTSQAHPNSGVSRPYAMILNQEETDRGGYVKNVHFSNNTCVSTLTGGGWTDSIGTKLGQSVETMVGFRMRYHQIYITNNLYQGWNRLLQIGTINIADDTQDIPAGPSHIYVFGNTFKWGANPMADVDPASGETESWIFIGDNDFIQSNVAHTAVSTPYNWIDPADIQIVQNPPNRITPP